MAAASLEPDIKDQKLSYEVIQREDAEEVLDLLKKTFFKVQNVFNLNIPKYIKILILQTKYLSFSTFIIAKHRKKKKRKFQSQKETRKFFLYSTQFPFPYCCEVGEGNARI